MCTVPMHAYAPNLMGETALIRAAEGQRIEVVKPLIKHTDVNLISTQGQNALMGNAPIVEWLSKHIDPMAVNGDGETALMYATKSGDAQCIKVLLPLCEISSVDGRGQNALMKAASWGNRKAVMQLMHHISLDEVDNEGKDALGVAKQSLAARWCDNPKGIQSVIDFLEAYKLSIKGFQNMGASTSGDEKKVEAKKRLPKH